MKPTESYEQGEPCLDKEKIVQALLEAEEQALSDKTRYDHHQVMSELRNQINLKVR